MKCHYIYDAEYGKVHIPGCWAAAIHGEGHCSCRNKGYHFNDVKAEPVKQKEELLLVKELEKENARLNRIIKNLLTHSK